MRGEYKSEAQLPGKDLEEQSAGVRRRELMKVVGGGVLGAIGMQAVSAEPAAAKKFPPAPMDHSGVFDVKEFGATGDGKTIDSDAINKAIDAAAAAGGGTVRFPAGTYASFSIRLKNNITLELGAGATLLAADSPASGGGYDLAEPNAEWEAYQDYGHNHFHNSLIWGENLENVAIIGTGLIHGLGLSRGTGSTAINGRPTPKAETPGVGNKSIALKLCHNVLLRDFSILKGGHFGILATGVDTLTIDNLRIDTDRDGMDIDCCANVRVSNCTVNSPWDDAIVLKSSYALGEARSTDNCTIANCYVTGGYELGSVLDATWKPFTGKVANPITGRIKFGTESNGGFRNITVSNCVFDKCQGLALETVDGAILEDISISNITMRDVLERSHFYSAWPPHARPREPRDGHAPARQHQQPGRLQFGLETLLDDPGHPGPRRRGREDQQRPHPAPRRRHDGRCGVRAERR